MYCEETRIVQEGLMSRVSFFFQAEDGIRDVAVTGVQTCALPIFFQHDWQLAPSVIGSDRPTLPAVDVPDTLTAGVPATVTAWTKMGWEGCERPGTARVTSDDLLVTVRLFDSVARRAEDEACPSVLTHRRRTVVIRFSGSGLGTVRFVGRDTIERRVVVR